MRDKFKKGMKMFIHDTPFLKSIRDPLIIVDSNRIILYINKSGAAVFGKNDGNVIGQKCHRAFHKTDSPCVICPIEPVLVKERTYITEKWMTMPDGSRKCGEIRSYPVFDDHRKLIAVTTIVVDITQNKNRQSNTDNDFHSIQFKLSKRETQILGLIAEGYSNLEIAENLNITINTVKSHIVSIFNKIGVCDRTQAAIIALKSNLI